MHKWQVINHHSTLEDFILKFFIILTALRTGSDHKTAVMFQKVKVLPFQQGTAEFDYTQYLTSYAAGFVLKQVSKVKDIKDDGSDQCYKVQTSAGKVQVSFHQSMLLPCCHMRKMLSKPLYDPKICDNRWTFAYYQSTQRLFVNSSSSSSLAIIVSKSKDVRKLSQHEKYRKAVVFTSELASVVSVASSVHFQRRIRLLKKLTDHWKNGEEVSLVEVGEGNPQKCYSSLYIDSFDEFCSEAESDADQNPHTSSSDAGHQQSANDSIDVCTEVASSGNSTELNGTLSDNDNARLQHQPSTTITNSCIDVSTSGHNTVVDSSAGNVIKKRKPLGKEDLS